jgi:hypothetical protein
MRVRGLRVWSYDGAAMTIAGTIQASADVLVGRSRLVSEQDWFARLVRRFAVNWQQTHPVATQAQTGEAVTANPDAAARRIISRTSLLSALSGALSGAATTAAELAPNPQLAAIGIPAALLAVGGEALWRVKLHVELTCTLGDLFGVRINPDDPRDLCRLYALTFRTRSVDPAAGEPSRALIHDLAGTPEAELARELGTRLVSEALLRNLVPGISVATSAYVNYRMTRLLGDNVRRYMRYQRALRDAFVQDAALLTSERELLIEGIWFIFTADGVLKPEETVPLANLLNNLGPLEKRQVLARFVLDEQDWLERIAAHVPDAARDPFLRALEVAAAVDKEVSTPEQKILTRAAHALGKVYDLRRTEAMIRSFENEGVLQSPAPN